MRRRLLRSRPERLVTDRVATFHEVHGRHNSFESGRRLTDGTAPRCAQDLAASNLDQPVRQFVALERARRKVFGQHATALLDGRDEAVAGASLLYCLD
jgi:hypothetical protein